MGTVGGRAFGCPVFGFGPFVSLKHRQLLEMSGDGTVCCRDLPSVGREGLKGGTVRSMVFVAL